MKKYIKTHNVTIGRYKAKPGFVELYKLAKERRETKKFLATLFSSLGLKKRLFQDTFEGNGISVEVLLAYEASMADVVSGAYTVCITEREPKDRFQKPFGTLGKELYAFLLKYNYLKQFNEGSFKT